MNKLIITSLIILNCFCVIAQRDYDNDRYDRRKIEKESYFEIGLKTLLLNDNTVYIDEAITSKSNIYGIGANYIFDPFKADRKVVFLNIGLNYFKYDQSINGNTPFSYDDIDYFGAPTTELAKFNFDESRTFNLLHFNAGFNFKCFDKNEWFFSLETKGNYFINLANKFTKNNTTLNYGAIYDEYGSPIEFPTTYYFLQEINVENAYGREFLIEKDLESNIQNPFSVTLGFNISKQLKNKHLIGLDVDYHHYLINKSFVYKNSSNAESFATKIKKGNERHTNPDYIFNIEDPNYIKQLTYFDNSKMFPLEIGLSYYFRLSD